MGISDFLYDNPYFTFSLPFIFGIVLFYIWYGLMFRQFPGRQREKRMTYALDHFLKRLALVIIFGSNSIILAYGKFENEFLRISLNISICLFVFYSNVHFIVRLLVSPTSILTSNPGDDRKHLVYNVHRIPLYEGDPDAVGLFQQKNLQRRLKFRATVAGKSHGTQRRTNPGGRKDHPDLGADTVLAFVRSLLLPLHRNSSHPEHFAQSGVLLEQGGDDQNGRHSGPPARRNRRHFR